MNGLPTTARVACAIVGCVASFLSYACSPEVASNPLPESEVATTIEIVASPGGGWFEEDTIRVTAVVKDRRGQPFHGGTVTWETTGSVVTTDSRSALIKLPAGSSQIRAIIEPGGGLVRLIDAISVIVAPRVERAFLWERDAGLREIPPPPGASKFVPVDINDAGQVLGTAVFQGSSANRRAYIWSAATGYTALGDFPGASGSDVEATAINESATVTGYTHDGFKGPVRPFVWTPQSGFTRPAFDEQSSLGSTGIGVNAQGTIAGTFLPSSVSRPFRWNRETGLKMLSLKSECGSAIALNDAGDVLGYEGTDVNGFGCSPRVYVLWDNAGQRVEIEACASVAPCGIEVRAINDARVVTGRRNGTAFRWSPSSGFSSIGYESADGYDINDAGDVVGALWYGGSFPFMWVSGGKIIDIPLLQSTLSAAAVAINNSGQVVGTAR